MMDFAVGLNEVSLKSAFILRGIVVVGDDNGSSLLQLRVRNQLPSSQSRLCIV